jgi:pimeloyl-ACP methyl ester carboxylesterase
MCLCQVAVKACILVALTVPFACGEPRLVRVDDRHLSIDCIGKPDQNVTVVLIAGAGRTARDWEKVQPEVATFARVCSYDRAGLGESGEFPAKLQTADEIVEDLHVLLRASGETGPYVIVGHSIAGIYARRFETRFPRETAGLVFVDSSHEEQVWRFRKIHPKGPTLDHNTVDDGFFIQPGQRLVWRTEVPVIVLSHGQAKRRLTSSDRLFEELQQDLAARSPRGVYRRAANSGHFIQLDEPSLVIEAIRDVLR